MSSVVISGDTSGAITVAAPAVAGSNTLTLPAATGTILVPGNASALTLATSVNLAGTNQGLFGSIPSWVNRITMSLSAVQSSTNSNIIFQLGTSGGIVSSGYASYSAYAGSGNIAGGTAFSTCFGTIGGNSSNQNYGHAVFTRLTGNSWAHSHLVGVNSSGPTYLSFQGGGSIALAAALTQLRILQSDGANFTAGAVNIMYE